MGKNKKRKQDNSANEQAATPPCHSSTKHISNPLEKAQQSFLKSLPADTRLHFFSPKHVTPHQRAEIWENQADLGEKLVNKYAWATPDARLLKIFQHFSPIVEVGCGSNAYWARWMHDYGDVDVIAFDVSLESGGKINAKDNKKKKKSKDSGGTKMGGLTIRQGGPTVLSHDPDTRDRTLFLCYPDEEEYKESDSEDEEDRYNGNDINDSKPKSMAAACLEHFTGSTIIHVGELFGDTLGLDQSPWGRSSSCEFQERLAAEYHCILKMKSQNNWLHVRDTLSVWKRSETCAMVYENDSDGEDESAEEDHYKYIPPEEQLPFDVAAPCVAHLLSSSGPDVKLDQCGKTDEVKKDVDVQQKPAKKKQKKNNERNQDDVIPGSVW
ncbi:hypothetical protein ACHAWO_008948 [Cyclotella atomus]|jgi:hypothetical protein|uniref:Uncharacterized protein n=1 Tax=Cyclotella atomus TaxID=382360 RepID=A0ABD3QH07_9STRA